VLLQAEPCLAQHLGRLQRLEVEVIDHPVEKVPVIGCLGVCDQHIQQAIKVLPPAVRPIPKVGQPRHVDRLPGLCIVDRQVGDLEQPGVVLHAPRPRLPRVAGLPHVRLVPDDPVVNASPIMLCHPPGERGPRVHVGHGFRAIRRIDRSPLRRTDQDRNDLPPRGQLGFHVWVGHVRGLPVCGPVGLDHVPPQDDAAVANAGLRRSLRIDERLHHPKPRVGSRRFGGGERDWTQEEAEDAKKPQREEEVLQALGAFACLTVSARHDQNSNRLKASAAAYPGFSPASRARWRTRSASFSGSVPTWLTCRISAAMRCSRQQLISSQ